MVLSNEERIEKRANLLAESIKNANLPRYGYFGYTSPLALGDDSLAPKGQRRTEFRRGNMLVNSSKCGRTSDSFFSVQEPLCINDPFIDPGKRGRRKPIKMRDDQLNFKPAGPYHISINKLGYEYVNQGKVMSGNREKVPFTSLRNIATNPQKKGGAGQLTPGVLFGFSEERKFPEHVPDDYDSKKKQDRDDHLKAKAKMQEVPFKGSGCSKLGLHSM